MNSAVIDKIKHTANTEVVRRLLIKYFMDKGFRESFDRMVYPAMIQDLPLCIPALSSKLEIVPHALDINPMLGKAVLGWNLFVLGNNRMFLGETYHNDLSSLARQINQGLIMPPPTGLVGARWQTTPKRIVTFVTRVLEKNQHGYVDLSPQTRPIRGMEEIIGRPAVSNPGQFFNKPARY